MTNYKLQMMCHFVLIVIPIMVLLPTLTLGASGPRCNGAGSVQCAFPQFTNPLNTSQPRCCPSTQPLCCDAADSTSTVHLCCPSGFPVCCPGIKDRCFPSGSSCCEADSDCSGGRSCCNGICLPSGQVCCRNPISKAETPCSGQCCSSNDAAAAPQCIAKDATCCLAVSNRTQTFVCPKGEVCCGDGACVPPGNGTCTCGQHPEICDSQGMECCGGLVCIPKTQECCKYLLHTQSCPKDITECCGPVCAVKGIEDCCADDKKDPNKEFAFGLCPKGTDCCHVDGEGLVCTVKGVGECCGDDKEHAAAYCANGFGCCKFKDSEEYVCAPKEPNGKCCGDSKDETELVCYGEGVDCCKLKDDNGYLCLPPNAKCCGGNGDALGICQSPAQTCCGVEEDKLYCCGDNQDCCSDGVCKEKNEICCTNPVTKEVFTCGAGQTCCGNQCVQNTDTCCNAGDSPSTICPLGEFCVNNPNTRAWSCCPQGFSSCVGSTMTSCCDPNVPEVCDNGVCKPPSPSSSASGVSSSSSSNPTPGSATSSTRATSSPSTRATSSPSTNYSPSSSTGSSPPSSTSSSPASSTVSSPSSSTGSTPSGGGSNSSSSTGSTPSSSRGSTPSSGGGSNSSSSTGSTPSSSRGSTPTGTTGSSPTGNSPGSGNGTSPSATSPSGGTPSGGTPSGGTPSGGTPTGSTITQTPVPTNTQHTPALNTPVATIASVFATRKDASPSPINGAIAVPGSGYLHIHVSGSNFDANSITNLLALLNKATGGDPQITEQDLIIFSDPTGYAEAGNGFSPDGVPLDQTTLEYQMNRTADGYVYRWQPSSGYATDWTGSSVITVVVLGSTDDDTTQAVTKLSTLTSAQLSSVLGGFAVSKVDYSSPTPSTASYSISKSSAHALRSWLMF